MITIQQLEKAIPVYSEYKTTKSNLESSLNMMRQYVNADQHPPFKVSEYATEAKFLKAKQEYRNGATARQQKAVEDAERQLKQLEENLLKDLAKI